MGRNLLVRGGKGLGAAQEGTETPASEDPMHPGHGMSSGKGERAAQPALRPVPGQPPQLLPPTCLRCAHSPALAPQLREMLSSSARRGKNSAEGQGPALPVPGSILCPGSALHHVVPGAGTVMGPSQHKGEERNQPPSARGTSAPNTGRMPKLESQGKGLLSAPGK